MLKRSVLYCVLAMIVVFAPGCRSTDKPDWVQRGTKEESKMLYAMGLSAKDPNMRMQLEVAKNMARTELGRMMETYVAAMIKDFMQSHKDFVDPTAASSIQFVQAVSKSVTEATLVGSQVDDQWKDPESGMLYVLMKMPKKDIVGQAKKTASKKAREQQAELFKAKAEEALKALDAELDKKHKAVQ